MNQKSEIRNEHTLFYFGELHIAYIISVDTFPMIHKIILKDRFLQCHGTFIVEIDRNSLRVNTALLLLANRNL